MQVFDNDLQLQGDLRQRRQPVGRLHLARAASVSVRVELESRTTQPARRGRITGEIYKMELDGTILGKFGKAGKALRSSAPSTRSTAAIPNELYVSEISGWRVQKIILRPQGSNRNNK